MLNFCLAYALLIFLYDICFVVTILQKAFILFGIVGAEGSKTITTNLVNFGLLDNFLSEGNPRWRPTFSPFLRPRRPQLGKLRQLLTNLPLAEEGLNFSAENLD